MLGCDEHTPSSKEGSDNRRENMDLVFIFTFVELGPDILECDASWYVPVIARAQVFKKLLGGWSAAMLRATLRQLAKFPMRWSSGADRDQPWLVRSLPVDCRATDGALRWGGHCELLAVERPRKHAAMRWALQCVQEGERNGR